MAKKPHPIYDAVVNSAPVQYVSALGKSWADDNTQAAENNPSTLAGLWRGVNPLTGYGSALGNAYTASREGDLVGVGLAALSAVPVFGSLTALKSTATGAAPFLGKFISPALGYAAPAYKALGRDVGLNALQSYASDQYNDYLPLATTK